MLLSNSINYDNTLKTMIEARQNQHLLNIPLGNEKQLYNINDIVTVIKGFSDIAEGTKAIIKDIYNNNGYFRYILQIERIKAGCKKKIEIIERNARQEEIKII